MRKLPAEIAMHLSEREGRNEDIGRSGATVEIFTDRVLKVQEICNVSRNEFHMLTWLQGKLPVPRVIAAAEEDGLRWLLMSRMPGEYLCTDALLEDQERLAQLCADALQRLWAVDVSSCPTDRTLNSKFAEIEEGLRTGRLTVEASPQPDIYDGPDSFASPSALFDWLVKHRPQEEPVLTHGDLCLPNIFADGNGLTGFIDMGLSGVADKWVDIEKCLWSMWANTTGVFGGRARPFERRMLFDALGMEPDEERLRYYGLLDALC